MAMIRPETEMKDSGIQWIGDIPNNWNIKPLYACLDEINQKNNPIVTTNILSLTNTDGVIPYSERGNQGNKSKENFEEYKVVYPNTIVANSMNILIGSVGLSKYEGCVSPVYYVYMAKPQVDIRYMNYLFQMEPFQKRLRQFANGILEIRLRVSSHDILHQKVAVPDYDEQQAIADYLDETCSKIDEIIAEAKASIDEYKELKQSVIFEAVTKGLDKNVEMKDSGVKAIGKVNNKYNVVKIAELNDGLTDGTHGTYKRFDSGKLLLSSKNVQHNGLVIGSNESYISEEDSNAIVANGFPQKDDLLLCCIGASIGRCILYPFDYPIAFQRSVIFIRCNKWILPKMMMYNLQSISSLMQEQMVVNVSAQAGLYQGLVKQLYIVVPPIDEQKQIILLLDKKTAEIDSLITEKESLINDLEAYKKSLIYEVVTGKRRVV